MFRPGIELDETIDEFDMPIDDVDRNRKVGVWKGSRGADLALRIFYRTALTEDSIEDAPWERYRGPFRATFGRIQARLDMAQDGDKWQFQAAGFAMRRFPG